MRIPYSGPALRAIFASVFSSKHLNRLSSAIARLAMGVMASVRSLRLPQSMKTNITRHVREVSGLTASCSKVVFDYIYPNSTLNFGLDSIQQSHCIFPIKGDGHCLFRSLAFGLLHQLQICPAPERSQFIQELIRGVKERLSQLGNANAAISEVRELAKTPEIELALKQFETTLHEYLDLKTSDELSLQVKLNSDDQSLPFIHSLRCLTTLYGLHLHTRKDPELFLSVLQNGSMGIRAENLEDYAYKLFNLEASKAAIVFGGDAEVQGFCKLLQLPVQTFSLSGIGSYIKTHPQADPLEATEACRVRYTPDENQDLAPITLLHYRLHYDAALPLPPTPSS